MSDTYDLKGCKHNPLQLHSSSHAAEIGYERPSGHQRKAAASLQKNSKSKVRVNSKRSPDLQDDLDASYPAPLVLPGDDLADDPQYPPQSFQEWLNEKERNRVTPKRNVIYVAGPPKVDTGVRFVESWSWPQGYTNITPAVAAPLTKDVVNYLAAYYHGMVLKLFPNAKLRFTTWEGDAFRTTKSKVKPEAPRYVGLSTSKECVRIRTRASAGGVYARQLNLDDLLDAAISILPSDAYALLLIVEHDLYEDANDEFICGRAYGGSRVAVISTARYHPLLDTKQNVELDHAWPASHCEAYIQAHCLATQPAKKKAKVQHRGQRESDAITISSSPTSYAGGTKISPLEAAVAAQMALPLLASRSSSTAALSGLWLGRVCRTASHELGHCFGIDHCVYYACAMQGSSSLTEDARQPPYLCPVDLNKILHATGTDMRQHYQALLAFCDGHKETQLFAAFAAWLTSRLEEMEN